MLRCGCPTTKAWGALLHEPSFQNLLPQAVFQRARGIQKIGNQAVHSNRPVRQYDALQAVKELHHLCHWLVRTYTPDAAQRSAPWNDALVPQAPPAGEVVPRKQLVALEQKLAEQNEAALKQQRERDELDAELQTLREQLAEIRAAAEQQPDPHDYSEAETRHYLRNHLNDIVIHRLRTNQPLTADDLKSLEKTLVEIGEDDGETLLSDLLARSEAPSLAHFVRSLVGMDRSAAQAAFSQFLNDRSLTAQQIRFVELVIDQLTARGVMDASALYEPPFSNLHAGGPDELFAGKETVINAVFDVLRSLEPQVLGLAG